MADAMLLFLDFLTMQAALRNRKRTQPFGGDRLAAATASAVAAILDARKCRIDIAQLRQLVAKHGDVGVVEEIRFGPVLSSLKMVEQRSTARFITRRVQCRANRGQCLGTRGSQRLFELGSFLLGHSLALMHSEGFSVRDFALPDE